MCSSLILGILIVFLAMPGPAAAQREDLIDELVRSNMLARGAPGAAVAVIQDGVVVYEAGYGVQSTDSGEPVTTKSLFRLGSTTKIVTAATLVRLAIENGIPLDAPIRNFAQGLDSSLSALTIHQILTHTAGIYDYAPMQGPDEPSALAEHIRSWTSDVLFTEPGKVFSYSNPGYWLAGYLSEVLSGSFFNEAVKDQIMLPAGIKNATFDPREVNPVLLADAHQLGQNDQAELFEESFNHAGTWPSGSLFISAGDFGRLLVAFMDNGIIEDTRVFPEEVSNLLLQSHSPIPFPDGFAYGYGVFRESWDGTEVFTHKGTRSGYGSMFIMVPEHRFAVVVLCNLNTTVLRPAAEGIVKEYLGLIPLKKGSGPKVTLREDEFEPFLGTYRNTEKMEIELYKFKMVPVGNYGGQFFFKMGPIKMPAYQIGQNRFHTSFVDFILIPDEMGEIEYLFGEFHALKKLP